MKFVITSIKHSSNLIAFIIVRFIIHYINGLFTHNLTGSLTSLAAHNKMSSEFRAKGLLYLCDIITAGMTSGCEQSSV